MWILLPLVYFIHCVFQTLYTYPENFRAYKILAAANYSGFDLKQDKNFNYGTTNKSEDFQKKFPMGKVIFTICWSVK